MNKISSLFDQDKFKEIWLTIKRNKFRSFLTGFGVGWGIFMFVIMFGLGNGIYNGIQQNIESVANSVFIFPGTTTMEYKGFNMGRSWKLTTSDVEMLRKNIPQIQHISGSISFYSGKVTRDEHSVDCGFRGVEDNFSKMEKINVIQGREINHLDIQEKRKICLIGEKVYEQLFEKNEDAIGKQISVAMGGLYFNVVGVISESNNMNIAGRRLSESVLIPISTMQQVCGMGQNIDMMSIAFYEDVKASEIEPAIKDLLKKAHDIAPQDDAAINMFNLQEMFLMFYYLFLGIKILIWIVGMGTLLAGVVGVSNIMLVSIRERTKEIGIRRALGAKPSVILKQIMGESITLTFIAGYAGFFFAVLVLAVIDKVTQANNSSGSMFADPQISFPMAIGALVVLIVFGLLAGIIPAQNALKIKAIDALRDE